MDRLELRTHLLPASCLALALLGCGSDPDLPPIERRTPDVVLVLIDTLRYDFTSFADASIESTPFLTELTASSVVFDEAYSPAPWTLPSLASILSGVHLIEHGLTSDRLSLPEDVPTLAQRLRLEGYNGIAMFRNPFAGASSGLNRGYAYSERTKDQTGAEHLAVVLDEHQTEAPLLIYIHNTEPHDPQALAVNVGRIAPEETREFSKWYQQVVSAYRVKTRLRFQREPSSNGPDLDQQQQEHIDALRGRQAEAYGIYRASVEQVDKRIAGIVAELKARGRWDNTLFVVMADHGEEMGEHGGWLHDQSLYNELIHVPFLLRFPGDEFAGTRITQPASLVDLVPTILGYMGNLKDARSLDGRNWYADLQAGSTDSGPVRVVSTRINVIKSFGPWKKLRGDRNLALRDGPYKAIWNQELDTLEIYDLESDPRELADLAADKPELVKKYRDLASAYWTLNANKRAPGSAKGMSQTDIDALQALGYAASGAPIDED